MAITSNSYTGNGSTTLYSFTFPYLDQSDVKVSLNGSPTTAYTFANATTIQFNTAPGAGVAIRIYRETDDSTLQAVFSPGSSIRASDLNSDFDQLLYLGQESSNTASSATSTANTALTTANTALGTANTALSNSSTAVSTANSAVSTANAASSAAASAVSTANTANTNASNAVTTANAASSAASTAVSTANSATATANSATGTANTALSTANTASTNASNAVSTANTASSNATTAVATANAANTTANTALSTANTASSNANTAVTTANAAAAAVANAVLYTTVANVAAIPTTPANNTAIEVTNSTGIESFTPLSGRPAGFVGSSGLSVRIIYQTSGSTWTWIQYFPNDPEARYLKLGGGTVTGNLEIGTTGSLTFEGSTADAFETTLAVVDPTADRTITLPNVTGTVVTTGDTGSVTNTMLAGSIDKAKVTGTAITAADTGTVTSTMILDGTIVDGDVNASAAIAHSKLANITAGSVLLGNATNVPTATALSGDVTVNSTGVTAIGTGVIVNADVNASAAIDGTKISPNFGSQNVVTTGTSSAAALIPTGSSVPTNGTYLPAANAVAIATNSTERLRIDSSGRVGIGSTAPGHALQVNGAICATGTFGTASASTVVLDVAGDARIMTTGPSGGGYNALAFAQVNASGGQYTQRAAIDSAGRFLLGVSNANANGGILQLSAGITFPASQYASADPNTLDDYEEGTWTPMLSFGGGSVGISYATAPVGYYTRVGRLVHVQFGFKLNNKGSSTGDVGISGLPFSISGTGSFLHASAAVNAHYLVSSGIVVHALGAGGTSFSYRKVSDSTADTALKDSDFTNIVGFYHSMVYFT